MVANIVSEQKIIFWRKKSLEPKFTIIQLTQKMESVGYEIVSCKKGMIQRERISIIDKKLPLTLNNIEILINVGT